jgi:hypothetical protein
VNIILQNILSTERRKMLYEAVSSDVLARMKITHQMRYKILVEIEKTIVV